MAVTKVLGDPKCLFHSFTVRDSSGFGSPSEGGRPESLSGLSLQDPNWYKAKNKVGREGIIPANYVQKREGVKAGTKLSLMP